MNICDLLWSCSNALHGPCGSANQPRGARGIKVARLGLLEIRDDALAFPIAVARGLEALRSTDFLGLLRVLGPRAGLTGLGLRACTQASLADSFGNLGFCETLLRHAFRRRA